MEHEFDSQGGILNLQFNTVIYISLILGCHTKLAKHPSKEHPNTFKRLLLSIVIKVLI